METRSPISIAAVLEALSFEKNTEGNKIEVAQLSGGKDAVFVDGVLIADPDAEAVWLKKTMKTFQLKEEDSVNKPLYLANGKGTTLLIQAIQSTVPEKLYLVKVLLDHGANPELTDSDGNNAFMYVAKKGGYNDFLILKELLSLVQNEEPPPSVNTEITVEEEKKPFTPPVLAETSTETETVSHKQAVGKTALRVKLPPDVLSKANDKGETVEQLVLSAANETPAVNKSSSPKKSPQKQSIDDPLRRLKVLTENRLTARTPAKKITPLSSHPTTPSPAIQEKTLCTATNSESMQKEQTVRNQYNTFYKNKLRFFKTQCREKLTENQKTQQQAAEKRALLRYQLQHHYGLILFVAPENEKISLDTLEELSKARNYEPILIKQGDQISIYGLNRYKLDGYSGPWTLSLLNTDEIEMLKKSNLLNEFKNIPRGQSTFLDRENSLLIENAPLKEMIKPHHAPNLNLKKQPHYDCDLEIELWGCKPVLPVSYSDQASIRAAFSLLKDYYAPEKAPLPHCLKWGFFRRLLTCNLRRPYCAEAERFYRLFNTYPLETTSDIMAIHLTVKTKLQAMQQLPHDKKECNTIFNSPYTQRLYCILKTLEETEAYQQETSCKLLPDDYLDQVDTWNGFTPP